MGRGVKVCSRANLRFYETWSLLATFWLNCNGFACSLQCQSYPNYVLKFHVIYAGILFGIIFWKIKFPNNISSILRLIFLLLKQMNITYMYAMWTVPYRSIC